MTSPQAADAVAVTPYRRPVSPTERLYLAAGDARGAMALRIVVEGEGVPERGRFQAALARAAAACPGSSLVRVGAIWSAEGPPPRVRYAAPRADASANAAQGTVVLPEPTRPAGTAGFTASTGSAGSSRRAEPPGCEVLIVPGSGSGADGTPTTIVFSASHAVMDGHGALTWVREVFRALRDEAPRPALDTDTDAGLLRRLGRTGPRPTPKPARRSPLGTAAGSAPARTLWLRRTLPGRHAALTARLAQALTDAARRDTRVMVPVDLRRHRPGIAATGNLSLPLFLDLHPGADWTAAHTHLLTALAEGRELAAGFETHLARLPSAVTAGVLRTAQALTLRTDRHLASAVVSHLGRLDLAAFSGGGFTASAAFALPVHAPLVPLSFVAAETGTATEITLGVRGAGPDLAARAAQLLDRTLAAFAGPAGVTRDRPGAGPGTPAPAPAQPEPHPEAAAPETTVVDVFRARAARTPDAPALDGPEGVVTYAELDRRSEAVAAALGRRGIGRGDLVGLVVDRTPAGVCALWGVLKAGAAYVPLDPAHPGARIGEVLRDCAAGLCLTRRHLAGELAPFVSGTVLLAVDDLLDDRADGCRAGDAGDEDGADAADADAAGHAGPAGPAEARPTAGDLAYVIHTSGSSGRPKGVQIEHGSLMGFVRWMTGICRITDRTRFGFASSYAFDISCFPLFLPLLAGGTTVLAPGAPSPAALRALVSEHRADTLALTPSHLALLGPESSAPTRPLRTLLLGGEALTPAAVRSARTAFGAGCRVVNAYGPTEATVAVLAHTVDGSESGATVPIGLPGPYARVDLVGADGEAIGSRPQDIGRTGEIVVRGVQVARGYLGAADGPSGGPPSPFTTGPDGIRAYRTGDLGRRLADGAIEFAGRIDDQVKIAGHRVEPAEVAAALEAHTAVHRAVVVPRRRPHSASAVLCAYAVPHPGHPGAGADLAEALRADLARTLPPHLVPARVVVVDALASTVSGKADLDALPDPFAAEPGAPAPHGSDPAPHGPDAAPLEARVRHHWAEILGVDGARLSADSDFHALGGDSLALVEMLTAVSADLLTPHQAREFTGRLDCMVRNLTLEQVCAHLTLVREEATA
ncbi:amino acid adenylation domain-containing protein [Streptomyces sp. NPDC059456]|uniref:amino acid adenylation domain-containing protein n=1 Tax=Streptomyces sp. NPDC059456 TaxID=3346838 RepID=UPI0036A4FE22